MDRTLLVACVLFIAIIFIHAGYSQTEDSDGSDSDSLWFGPRLGRKKRNPFKKIILNLPTSKEETSKMLNFVNQLRDNDLITGDPDKWKAFLENVRKHNMPKQTEINQIGALVDEKNGEIVLPVLYSYVKKNSQKHFSDGDIGGLEGKQSKLVQSGANNYGWEVLVDKGDKHFDPAVSKLNQIYGSNKEVPGEIEDGTSLLFRSPPFSPRLGRAVTTSLRKL